jgi:hypothetical protein
MNFDKEIRNILRNAGVKLSESKASEEWEKEFAERNGIPDGYDETDDEFFDPKLVHNDEEYQRGADEYWRTYLQQKKNTEGLTPDEEEELAELEVKYKRSLN